MYKVPTHYNTTKLKSQNDQKLTERAFFWDVLLKTYSSQSLHLSQPSPLSTTKLDLPQQRTLHLDVPRTRCQHIPKQSHLFMEQVITHFCRVERLGYKQGLNEFFGVVSVFNGVGLSWEKIWEYGRAIILNYSNNLFQDEEFLSLQITLSLVNLLFKYHDPKLQHYIEQENNLTPELYATPWILTLFANKMTLDVVLLFWEAYFIEGDKHLIIFFVVATLLFYRDKITSIDSSFLPQTLTGIVISSKEHLSSIFKKSLQLRANTPTSFVEYIVHSRVYENYTLNNEQNRIKQIQLKLDKTKLLWMTVNECLKILYPQTLHKQKRKIRPELRKFVNDNKDLLDIIDYEFINPIYQLVDVRQNLMNGTINQTVRVLGEKSKFYILMDEDGHYDLDSFIRKAHMDGYSICLLQGGYKMLHDQMLIQRIKIDQHQPSKCQYCVLQEPPNDGIWNQFVKFFVMDDDTQNKSSIRISQQRKVLKCKKTDL